MNGAPLLSLAGRPLPAQACAWIAHFKMERIPQEGGWFAPATQSDEVIDAGAWSARYVGSRRLYNSIMGVQTADDFSALHRLKSDELWHFYEGAPLELLLLHPDGRGETVLLGSDLAAGQRRQVLVPRGVWQGSRPLGDEDRGTLMGHSMAPGFDYVDFEIGHREPLQARYPGWIREIEALTRLP